MGIFKLSSEKLGISKKLSGIQKTSQNSDWTPLQLQSKLLDWYSPESYDSITPQWNDLSINGNTLVKQTNNPLTGISIDGKSTLEFTGAGWLEHAVGDIPTSDVNIFFVVRTDLVATTQLLCDANVGTAGKRVTAQVITGSIFRGFAGSNLTAPANSLIKDTVHLLRLHVSSGIGGLYVNDIDANPLITGSIGTSTWAGLAIGASNAGTSAFQGDVAEVFRTNSTLTTTEKAQIETYLINKYPSAAKATLTITDLFIEGDSISQGIGSTDGYGWKSYVRTSFEASDVDASHRLRFVGPRRQKCMSNDALSGRILATMRDGIAAQVTAYPPGVVVYFGGTNDCQGDDGAYDSITTPAKLMDGITNLRAVYGGPLVLVLIPAMTNSTNNANVNDFNQSITESSGIYDQSVALGFSKVVIADCNTGFNPATHADDGVHPNDLGVQEILGPRLTSAIRLALS